MNKTIILSESYINDIIHRVIVESLYSDNIEDVPTYEILNGNFDGDWRNIITARLYNEKDEDVGSLYDLHFKYMTDNNKLVGERNWI